MVTTNNERINVKWLALSSVLFLLFVILSFYISRNPVNFTDISVSRAIQATSTAKFLATTDKIFGELTFRIICLILFSLLLFKKAYYLAYITFSSMFVEVISYVVKIIVKRERPTSDLLEIAGSASGYSFISGHTFEYAFIFWFLAASLISSSTLKSLVSRNYRIVLAAFCFIIPIIVGLDRIYVGDHWFSDVIGSYLLAGSLISLLKAFQRS